MMAPRGALGLVLLLVAAVSLSDAFAPGVVGRLPSQRSGPVLRSGLQSTSSVRRGAAGRACWMRSRPVSGEGSIGNEVEKLELSNALDPKSHSLSERLDHTVHELQDLYDAVCTDIENLEEELAEKKYSKEMLLKRLDMLKRDLSEASSEEQFAKGAIKPALIIGGGRVGQLLYDNGSPGDEVVRSTVEYKFHMREHPGGSPKEGPIYLCVHNEQLEELIAATPEDRKEDLVYMGTYTHEEMQAISGGTVAALYFQVVKLGEAPEDPIGLTVVNGKWADDFGRRLQQAGVTCHIGDETELAVAQLQYKVWVCAVHLVGKLNGCVHVVEVEKEHGAEFESLLRELGDAAEKKEGIKLPEKYVQTLREYTALTNARVAVHASRNDYFCDISKEALAQKKPDPCPLHSHAYGKIKAKNLLVKDKHPEHH